jgi:hypothetical protein
MKRRDTYARLAGDVSHRHIQATASEALACCLNYATPVTRRIPAQASATRTSWRNLRHVNNIQHKRNAYSAFAGM